LMGVIAKPARGMTLGATAWFLRFGGRPDVDSVVPLDVRPFTFN
jgi:hypothetical protein